MLTTLCNLYHTLAVILHILSPSTIVMTICLCIQHDCPASLAPTNTALGSLTRYIFPSYGLQYLEPHLVQPLCPVPHVFLITPSPIPPHTNIPTTGDGKAHVRLPTRNQCSPTRRQPPLL